MSISDELRKEARDLGGYIETLADAKELDALANRIDNEMVELPLSADGYIWTGREECFWTNAEQEGYHSFGCVALRNGKWHVEDIDGMDYEAESVWYERPDSFERIADELDEWKRKAAEKIPGFGLEEDALHALADRIRKLAKEGQ